MTGKILIAALTALATALISGCASNGASHYPLPLKNEPQIIDASLVELHELRSVYVSSTLLTSREFGEVFFLQPPKGSSQQLDLVKHVEVRSTNAYMVNGGLDITDRPCAVEEISEGEKLPVTHVARVNGRSYELARLRYDDTGVCYAAIQNRKFAGILIEQNRTTYDQIRVHSVAGLRNVKAVPAKSFEIKQTTAQPTYVVLTADGDGWVEITMTPGSPKSALTQTHKLFRSESVLCGGGCLLSYAGLTPNGHAFIFRGADYE